jgi:hypothetical protein
MKLINFILSTLATVTSAYYGPTAYNGVILSGAAYCDESQYMGMQPLNGFVVDAILYDPKTDLLGFTGFLPSDKTIYLSFRGSSSTLNWIDDAEIAKTNYQTFPACDCKVHSGFYKAALNLRDAAYKSVTGLISKHHTINVVVTGHSLGAAVAQLIGMELLSLGINTQLYNYGQPRVGDATYAAFVNMKLKSMWRFTHNRDPVPHLPPESFGYKHACVEIFENHDSNVKECSKTNCEDPSCADQYSLSKKNASDHSIYLGYALECRV